MNSLARLAESNSTIRKPSWCAALRPAAVWRCGRRPLPAPRPNWAGGGAGGIVAVPPTFIAMNRVPVANPTYCVSSTM